MKASLRYSIAIYVILLLFFVVSMRTACATIEIFMQVSGVPGESVAPDHSGWIDCLNFSGDIKAPSTQYAKFSLEEISIQKAVDKSTPLINQLTCAGSVIPCVKIDMVRDVGVNPCFYQLIYTNVVFVDSNISADVDTLEEYIAFRYQMVQWTYTQEGVGSLPTVYADTEQARAGYVSDNTDGDALLDINDPDDDNDGFADWKENIAGSSPVNSNSVFRVSLHMVSATNAILEWTSVPDRTYEIFVASSVDGVYVPSSIGAITNLVEGIAQKSVPVSSSRKFYRVQVKR